MKPIGRLVIIGNGFDRFHGIPSDFTDFARYLHTVDWAVCRMVDEYFSVDDKFWGQFEARLADFDAERAVDYPT
ncbi:MAG: bacteriophage abortive infection AbiH family protein [Brevundimonas sp.]|jgi:hypothetical protein|uniref:AbiH family protein n=1 Tax=Brevundimonas sp. TaxID=1871086 RepID=UPI0025B92D33|nr:AbiH family protein [Brevundimonas sp.]MCH4269666.1 bacteriophage abortive infection AbiH family protein [Brevundimonas sp.]